MKITIAELKKIIREVVSEEATPPGRWSGGGVVDPEEWESVHGGTSQKTPGRKNKKRKTRSST